ncbi:MAG: ABC transporter permease, partial [Epulopiscium sp.]|nr:ABC transporter permease [Candidatus Epulonipiscium sp.]
MQTELIFDLLKSLGETFQMVGIALILSIVLGIPLGLFLYLTSSGLFFKNKILNFIG